jgi:carbon-monoxide dehydrogenase medium subunit
VRNLATLGGNICNAAPSADSAPILIAMGAKVGIFSTAGERKVPLEEFFKGPGATVLGPGEILTRVTVDKPAPGTGCGYVKHKIRETLEIAITGVAVAITVGDDGTCREARVVVGACAPTPIRARKAEELLKGTRLGQDDLRKAGEAAASEIAPIDDVRGSADYRREMTAVSLERAVEKALGEVGR